jgi:hypothetical protein
VQQSFEARKDVDQAMHKGLRSLSPGTSLAPLLAKHRNRRNQKSGPPLTEEQSLAWADAHFRRTEHWPNDRSGAIDGVPGESWCTVDYDLKKGIRTLPGGYGRGR